MSLYWAYRLGYLLSNSLPVKSGYSVAETLAVLHYYISSADRRSVKKNLGNILGPSVSGRELSRQAREVFINFAKYLVDFFRFSSINDAYIRDRIKIRGIDNVDKGLVGGKGVILLSAHIGNWELGGQVCAQLRQPLAAVVLPHQDKRINDFFTRQRMIGKMKPIETGISLRGCYEHLKTNGMLAMLGDRDFSKNGIHVPFFGREMLIPKGPAVFSRRLGACIVPCFMIREKDDTFTLTFEPPIFPDMHEEEDGAVRKITERYTSVIEGYVKNYPTQWYLFREAWNGR
jgi:KDO2-lipid IV(A) lauroyltransferase